MLLFSVLRKIRVWWLGVKLGALEREIEATQCERSESLQVGDMDHAAALRPCIAGLLAEERILRAEIAQSTPVIPNA